MSVSQPTGPTLLRLQPVTSAQLAWMAHIAAARQRTIAWRAAAVGSASLALTLSGAFSQAIATQQVPAVHVVQLRDPHAETELERGCVDCEATVPARGSERRSR